MAEHMVCNHGVRGSNPLTSTRLVNVKPAPRASVDTNGSFKVYSKGSPDDKLSDLRIECSLIIE